jgi:SAM-dependent methyltransferase
MKNKGQWRPSKFVYKNNKLIASRDAKELSISSRLVGDIVASYYDRYLKQHAKGLLLDLGCGKVPLYHAYVDFITDCICVDWKNTVHKNPYLDLECDLNLDIPLATAQFQTILLSDVLEHIREPEHLWSEISRLLHAGGKVILNVPFFYKLHETPFDYYRYTEFILSHYAIKYNFRVEILQAIGGIPEIACDIAAKQFLRLPLLGKLFSSFIQWSCSMFLSTSLGKKLSASSSKHYPLGYFMVITKN